MKPASELTLKRIVESRADAAGLLRAPGEAVLIERGRPRWLLLACPCGCGEELPINLDPRAGKAWRLYATARHGISLFPSVWRDTKCQSHFIIWRNHILLFRDSEEFWHSSLDADPMPQLGAAVLAVIPPSGFIAYSALADALNEVPWDVLEACRRLVRSGQLVEGWGDQRGRFARAAGAATYRR